MEVHAHTHTPRKKWTHYFWEFLMLFLAVFCGFLAENQREHFVEAHRARDYAKSLLNDLRFDTGELRRGINSTRFTLSSIDSIIWISKRKTNTNTIPRSFYYYSKFISQSYRMDWTRSTIDQLIQSGNLRYFRNKSLVGLINSYYYLQGLISAQNQIEAVHRDKTMELRNNILLNSYYNLEDFNFSATIIPSRQKDSLDLQFIPLQEDAARQMDRYLNFLVDRKWRLNNLLNDYYADANRIALEIINELVDEYNLK